MNGQPSTSDRVETITEQIEPMLHGERPEIVAAVLGELLAKFISNHIPMIRDKVLETHIDYVKQMVPVEDEARKASGLWPSEWSIQ